MFNKQKADRVVGKAEDLTEYFSDVADIAEKSGIVEAVVKALPWTDVIGDVADGVPVVKTIVKVYKTLTKETNPEKLGFIACTAAFQKITATAFKKIGNPPSGTKIAVKEAKEQLAAIDFKEVDMGTFDVAKPFNHKFYQLAMLCLEITARNVDYANSDIEKIKSEVNGSFQTTLGEILVDEKFKTFPAYLELTGDNKRSRKFLGIHADYQRWLYEESPVLRISPFALKDVYIETDCSELTWADVKDKSRDKNPFDIETKDRKPLLETVMRLIKSKELENAIIIQGIAGSGKSSFTLRLCNELLENGLHPICIRIGDLAFDKHIKDDLPNAVRFGEEDEKRESNLFLNDAIFEEKGVGEFEHISKYVLILDGWDEISQSNEGFKKKVSKMLDELNGSYLTKRPKVRVILTGRPTVDFTDANCLREKSPFLTLLKMTPPQLENYVNNLLKAIDSPTPLITPTEQTEFWKVPNKKRFQEVFKLYTKEFDEKKETKLEVLGLPLLTYLTVRLVSEWKGDLSPLLENQTTLYRHLIDLTCKNAARMDSSNEKKDQHKLYGNELRDLLRQTASAITICGSENISKQELALRLELDENELGNKTNELQKESKLSALLISFYFKGGHAHLGCEFAHKSFREYFFAEAIVEKLKEYGREQRETPPKRDNYWEDFVEYKHGDCRFKFSRELSKLLSPQWLTPEVKEHLRSLLIWEIERAIKPDGKKPIGSPTESITLEQWLQIRTGLADLWEWWGEGVHMRLQPSKIRTKRDPENAYVDELVKWAAPQADSFVYEYVRTTTMDAHLGDGLFELCAITHTLLAEYSTETDREYQSIVDIFGIEQLLFRPTGKNENYFQNYLARINSAGWKQFSGNNESLDYIIDFSDTRLTDTDLAEFSLVNSTFENSFMYRASLIGVSVFASNFQRTELVYADCVDSDFRYVNFYDAVIVGSDFSSCDFENAILTGTEIEDCNFENSYFLVDFNILGTDFVKKLKKTRFKTINLDNTKMKRTEAFKYLGEKLTEYKEKKSKVS